MCYGEALSAAVVRARKQHRCGDCGRRIEPGSLYQKRADIWEGDFQSTKSCRTCASAKQAAFAASDEHCIIYSGDERAELRGEPWRETLRRLRAAWRHLRGLPEPGAAAEREVQP